MVVARKLSADRRRRKLGLPRLSSPKVTVVPEVQPDQVKRMGFSPKRVANLPYEMQGMDYSLLDDIVPLDDPGVPTDADGVAMWTGPDRRQHRHPVTIAQYALATLAAYQRTNVEEYLSRSIANAKALLELSELDEHGARWFPYRFPHQYYDVRMPVPWWSGMAQGHALSLFCRLTATHSADSEAESTWRLHAAETFRSFTIWRRLGQPWVTAVDHLGYLWFEEYAADVPPLQVINGHVFALYGIYDHAMLSQDSETLFYFDAAATTALEYAEKIRVPGGVSYYCTRDGYCQRPEWQHQWYHGIHVQQYRMLAAMTGDERFNSVAEQLASDFSGY